MMLNVGRCGMLMVASMLDSGSSSLALMRSLHCALIGKTIIYLTAPYSMQVLLIMGSSELNTWVNSHPGGSRRTPSCLMPQKVRIN